MVCLLPPGSFCVTGHADSVRILGVRTQVVAIMTIDLFSGDWRLS